MESFLKMIIKNILFAKFKMKFAKSHFCSPNLFWVRQILVCVRQVKVRFANQNSVRKLKIRQIVRQVVQTHGFPVKSRIK